MKQDNKKIPGFIYNDNRPDNFKVTSINKGEYMGNTYSWSSNAKGWHKDTPEQSLPSKEETIKEQSSNRGEGDILEGITPGGWIISEEDTTGEFTVVARPYPKDGGDIICDAPIDWEDSMKRWRANARLISLAPQLAKENKELKERIDKIAAELRRAKTFEELATDTIKEKEKQNKLLREALRKMYITFNTHDNVDDWLILEEAKQALNQ